MQKLEYDFNISNTLQKHDKKIVKEFVRRVRCLETGLVFKAVEDVEKSSKTAASYNLIHSLEKSI